ncbi:NifU family protein [Micromonospora sp. NPDC093277]|uniref:NifU family protein n=1 Tax=Micromonospora sp. NPDC093277 TaxID=3364291 RepID=UPI003805B861
MLIPIHPQPVPDRPDQLRWITPGGVLPFRGVAATVPDPLDTLLRDGTLEEVRVETAAVVTTLRPGRTWSGEGTRVRSALHAALADPAGWRPGGATGETDDAPLREAAHALLDGQVGEFARSHGGHIELVGVHDGTVTVRLGGACRGCPASRLTLRHRLEDQLRRRCPDLVAVNDVADQS